MAKETAHGLPTPVMPLFPTPALPEMPIYSTKDDGFFQGLTKGSTKQGWRYPVDGQMLLPQVLGRSLIKQLNESMYPDKQNYSHGV